MEAKRCGSCGRTKPVTEFHRKGSGYRDRCKECSRKYHREHYLKNKSRYLKLNARRTKKYHQEVAVLLNKLRSVPCSDCGRIFPPYVMDFDHVRGKKLFEISNGGRRLRLSFAKILAETKKCDVVCSNCHRIRTHQRRLDRRKGRGRMGSR